MGLALESIIGRLPTLGEGVCIVPENYLESLIMVANERFEENKRRISRFRSLLWSALSLSKPSKLRRKEARVLWEDAAARRERKKMEGLKRSLELRQNPEMTRHELLEDT
jgi:tRNA wybutosine-synthesizing protein 3